MPARKPPADLSSNVGHFTPASTGGKTGNKRKLYTDDEKAAGLVALELAGGDVSSAVEICGVEFDTLNSWKRGFGIHPHHRALANKKREPLADIFERIAYTACGMILLGDKLEKASASQLIMIAGVSVDKLRILRDQPTEITEVRQTREEIRAELLADYLKMGCSEEEARNMVERAFAAAEAEVA